MNETIIPDYIEEIKKLKQQFEYIPFESEEERDKELNNVLKKNDLEEFIEKIIESEKIEMMFEYVEISESAYLDLLNIKI